MRRYPMQVRIENSAKIPDELMQFVKKDTFSLIIKGAAGTGKTTLSLTILRALEIKDNFFYICTRVSPKQLLLSYPWISKFNEGLKEETPTAYEVGNPVNFEDARLDEPESLFERITNELMDVKAPLIIIDSWDAVASFMDREARLNNERVLQTWRERAGAKLIFVNEDATDSSLDFVVDGAVKLDQVSYEDIRLREISLLKLRGVKISKPSYAFTLDKGNFRVFQNYNPKDFVVNLNSINFSQFNKKKYSQGSSLNEKGLIKTGYNELDMNLGGGFPKRGVAVIEVETDINMQVAMAFLFRIIWTFLKSGNVVFFEPPDGIDPVSLDSYLKAYLSIVQTHTERFFLVGSRVKDVTEPSFSGTDENQSEHVLSYFYKKVLEQQQYRTNRLLLGVLSSSRLQDIDSRMKLNHINFARQNIDLTIFVARKSESIRWVSEICDIIFRICVVKGSLFLKTPYPLSPFLAMEVDSSFGYPMMNLIPLV
jgi:KaiC/GvpD/RAD55 family RecA-like ATPase